MTGETGEVIAAYETTASEYAAVNSWLQRKLSLDTAFNPLGGKLVAAGLTVVIMLFLIWVLNTWKLNLSISGSPVSEAWAWLLVVVVPVVILLFFVAQMLVFKRRIQARMLSNYVPRQTRLLQDQSGVTVDNGIAPARFLFDQIDSFETLGAGYAITSGLQAHFIPRRGFVDNAAEVAFLTLLRDKLKPGIMAKDIHAQA
jgi:hypothetical protein